jgi:N-methylhydantoinase A
MARQGTRVGVDIGGTFTDLVVLDELTGAIRTLKESSTPEDPSIAVQRALNRAEVELGLDLAHVRQFTHATTVASNTLLQKKGAKTALIVTEGFRDILEIQRHKRFDLFDLSYRKLDPLVPRNLAFGLRERIDAAGQVVTPVVEQDVVRLIEALKKEKVEAVAICFLFSFVNDAHEALVARMVRDRLPGAFVSVSSEVYPQYREYERTSTTVVNALLGPEVSTYLGNLSRSLAESGVPAPLHVMQSNGGITPWRDAQRMPCRIVESGPAAGVIAAAHFGALASRRDLIAFDMGGTTAKAGLVEDGAVRQTLGQEVGAGINISRLLQGGGYYVGAPTVDLAEVGAGGGSIAWIDSGGVLKVGPESAGADPGPVAYGQGGSNVTVTDANLLLGRIPETQFLGGRFKLDVDRAAKRADEAIARPLGIALDEACSAIIEVANASMLKMMRIVTVEKGLDPSGFTIVASGGNGAVFAAELANELGIREVLVPPSPGLLSAQGLLMADIRHDFRKTFVSQASKASPAAVERMFRDLESTGRIQLQAHGIDDKVQVSRFADMRYRRQAFELTIPVPEDIASTGAIDDLVESFHVAHERLYGRRDEAGIVEFVLLSVSMSSKLDRPPHERLPEWNGEPRKPLAVSPIFFVGSGRIDCPAYRRTDLAAGEVLAGPCLIGSEDSTVLVPPNWRASCDSVGNLFLSKSE